jgi:thiamine biosynthesis lipoprotein
LLLLLLPAGCSAPQYREARLAMSTTLTVLISGGRQPDWEELYGFADAKAREFDHRYPDSPVGMLNAGGEEAPPPEVLEVLKTAERIAVLSGGAFDPLILSLTSLWSFDSGGRLPDPAEIRAALGRIDYEGLRIEPEGRVRLPSGSGLDLGGIAKGGVVDLLADHLASQGRRDFLIDAGGDILVSGLKQGGKQWVIGIRHPRRSQEILGVVSLGSAGGRTAIVTSGDYERYFEVDGVRYHHILDPRTGYPARGLVSVTVMAPSCAVADALATAVFVLGPVQGLELLEKLSGVEGLLVGERDGELYAERTSGFPLQLGELKL